MISHKKKELKSRNFENLLGSVQWHIFFHAFLDKILTKTTL